MWSGQDPVEPQSLWGNPPQTQSMWPNGGGAPSQNSYNRQPQPQQWPSQMAQWRQYQQQAPLQNWQQQQQQQHHQMGWQNASAGYGGYEDKKMNQRGGYSSGYGYNSGMSQSSSHQPWAGQRVTQYQSAPWESPATTNGSGWGSSGGGGGGQYRGEWQGSRENDVSCNGTVGMQQPRYDSWPSSGGDESDKYMWRDPKPKKKIRDTGTQVWGDPCGQQEKILRWKDADHEEFQRGPSSSTWNQGSSTWVDSNESSCWPANVWENPEAYLADDAEPRPLNFNEEPQAAYRSNSFSGPKNNEYSEGPAVELTDSSIFALHATFQRAMVNGYLPANMKNIVLDQRQKMMVNTLLQKMVKKEQAEAELEHIRQIMASGEYPVTVAEHDRITNEREKTKMEIAMISEELKLSTQPPSPWNSQWQKRAMPDANDQLSAALGNMGISEPEFPNTGVWPSDGNLDWVAPPISVNTDLDKPLVKIDYESNETGQTENGPKEFIPGKKWEWNDPAKVAEDPNATPGSMKMAFGSPNWVPGGCDPWGKPEKKPNQDNNQEN